MLHFTAQGKWIGKKLVVYRALQETYRSVQIHIANLKLSCQHWITRPYVM